MNAWINLCSSRRVSLGKPQIPRMRAKGWGEGLGTVSEQDFHSRCAWPGGG